MLISPLRLSAVICGVAILAACAARTISAPAPEPVASGTPALILEREWQADATLTTSSLSNDPSGNPRWRFYDPLIIASNGSFTVASTYTTCSLTTALTGPWYYSYGTFSLPNGTSELASCVLHKQPMAAGSTATPSPTPSPTPASTSTPTAAPVPTPTPDPNIDTSDDLYIVKVDMSSSGVQIAAIAGPAVVTSTQFTFPSLVNPESFQNGHFYEFYVAKYLEPAEPVPVAH